MKILMVCLGNICRSPLAEGILKQKATERGLDWQVDSAGTGSWHVGELPDSRSIQVARHHGLDITDQRSRQFTAADFDIYDVIFAMDSSNYQNIQRLFPSPNHSKKVELIMNMSNPNMNQAVPDPYYGEGGFEKVYQMLDEACEAIVEKYASA